MQHLIYKSRADNELPLGFARVSQYFISETGARSRKKLVLSTANASNLAPFVYNGLLTPIYVLEENEANGSLSTSVDLETWFYSFVFFYVFQKLGILQENKQFSWGAKWESFTVSDLHTCSFSKPYHACSSGLFVWVCGNIFVRLLYGVTLEGMPFLWLFVCTVELHIFQKVESLRLQDAVIAFVNVFRWFSLHPALIWSGYQ